jgi:hypothetical protein
LHPPVLASSGSERDGLPLLEVARSTVIATAARQYVPVVYIGRKRHTGIREVTRENAQPVRVQAGAVFSR